MPPSPPRCSSGNAQPASSLILPALKVGTLAHTLASLLARYRARGVPSAVEDGSLPPPDPADPAALPLCGEALLCAAASDADVEGAVAEADGAAEARASAASRLRPVRAVLLPLVRHLPSLSPHVGCLLREPARAVWVPNLELLLPLLDQLQPPQLAILLTVCGPS